MMHIISTHLVAPLFGLIQLALCAENDIEIQPKQQVPEEGASSVIDQSYLGFGCEMTSFPDYAGT